MSPMFAHSCIWYYFMGKISEINVVWKFWYILYEAKQKGIYKWASTRLPRGVRLRLVKFELVCIVFFEFSIVQVTIWLML
jgi:hypothetical protein